MIKKFTIVFSLIILGAIYQIVTTEQDKSNAVQLELKVFHKDEQIKRQLIWVRYLGKLYSISTTSSTLNEYNEGDSIVVYYLPNVDEMTLNQKENYLLLLLLLPGVILLLVLNRKK